MSEDSEFLKQIDEREKAVISLVSSYVEDILLF